MAATQVQVLLAVLDAVHSASRGAGAHAGRRNGRRWSKLVRLARLLDSWRRGIRTCWCWNWTAAATVLESVRERHPGLPIVVALTKPTDQIAFTILDWVRKIYGRSLMVGPRHCRSGSRRCSNESRCRLRGLRVLLPMASWAAAKSFSYRIAIAAPDDVDDRTTRINRSLDAVAAAAMVGANPRMAEIRDTVDKVASHGCHCPHPR